MRPFSLAAIREIFGEDAYIVCTHLRNSSGRTLPHLSLLSKLSYDRCARILYTLLRHGRIAYKWRRIAPYHGEEVIYYLLPKSALRTSEMTRNIKFIRSKLGHLAARIFCCVVLHGHLTSVQVENIMRTCDSSTAHRELVFKAISQLEATGMIEPGLCDELETEAARREPPSSSNSANFWKPSVSNVNKAIHDARVFNSMLNTSSEISAHVLRVLREKENSKTSEPLSKSELVRTVRQIHKTSEKSILQTISFLVHRSVLLEHALLDGRVILHMNKNRLTHIAQVQVAETTIKERFGMVACRIFRLLINTPQLEQKQVSEMAMVPLKDCREILGKLLKHEYVRMQEVARTADHAPSRTSYLWKVDLPSVLSKIDLEIETATDNLNMRLSYEELGMRPCQYLSSSYKHAGDIIPFGGSTPAQTGRSTALLELGIFRLGETHLAFYS